MRRTWTTQQVVAGTATRLPNGRPIRFDNPSDGVLPHVFAVFNDHGGERAQLLEVRHNVQIGEMLLCVEAVGTDWVRYRTAQVSESRVSLRDRISGGARRPTMDRLAA